jgi:hypothetical protein
MMRHAGFIWLSKNNRLIGFFACLSLCVFLCRLDPPTGQVALFHAEGDSGADDLAPVVAVGSGIVLLLDLLQCFVCRTAEFEFENVNSLRRFDDGINPARGGAGFGFNRCTDQLEDGEEDGLVILFFALGDVVGVLSTYR